MLRRRTASLYTPCPTPAMAGPASAKPSTRSGRREMKISRTAQKSRDLLEVSSVNSQSEERCRPKRRLVELLDDVVVEGHVSRATRQPRDFELYSVEPAYAWEDPREFSVASSSLQAHCSSSVYDEEAYPRIGSVSAEFPPPFAEPRESDFSYLGSWDRPRTSLEQEPRETADGRGRKSSFGSSPVGAPRAQKLATPQMVPMSTDYEFCSCCEDEQDRINETWYLSGKARVDTQSESAIVLAIVRLAC
ncbi:hypothetical protein G7046_g1684 [Stylonectria norvegica]|nr:hypothetical protein G7046_g1684 [Stylonectria norvegica]